jgi:hypothetical protein
MTAQPVSAASNDRQMNVFTVDGVDHLSTDVADRQGVTVATLRQRKARGWTDREIVAGQRHPTATAFGAPYRPAASWEIVLRSLRGVRDQLHSWPRAKLLRFLPWADLPSRDEMTAGYFANKSLHPDALSYFRSVTDNHIRQLEMHAFLLRSGCVAPDAAPGSVVPPLNRALRDDWFRDRASDPTDAQIEAADIINEEIAGWKLMRDELVSFHKVWAGYLHISGAPARSAF